MVEHRTGDNPQRMVLTMSQAFTNIASTTAFCKAAPQPTQRQTGVQHTGRKPRPPTSADQKTKLSASQLAYIDNDPRWTEHRRKLAAAQEARRMTLFPDEVTIIVEMREKGHSWPNISKKIGVCLDVMRRELATDPQWIEHGRKLAVAKEARRMKLFENEVTVILDMRKKGRTFEYIAEEIGVCRDVITRELAALGVPTGRVKADRRARRGKGFWRSFD